MSFSIAVAGKGGTGKTTLAGLIVRYLVEKGLTPVLALDADANANLKDVLGVEDVETIGAVREEISENIANLPAGMTKESFMEFKIQEALAENKGFDLMVMGRPEGPGCYCYANSIFRKYTDLIAANYRYIVLDNEAGMEHMSRRMTQDIDLMIVVTDSSIRGIESAGRINTLADELDLQVKKRILIVNRAPERLPETAEKAVLATGLELGGVIPEDAEVTEFDLVGEPLFNLPETVAIYKKLGEILKKYKVGEKTILKGV